MAKQTSHWSAVPTAVVTAVKAASGAPQQSPEQTAIEAAHLTAKCTAAELPFAPADTAANCFPDRATRRQSVKPAFNAT